MGQFQFLIGTIKTVSFMVQFTFLWLFQFLIGTIKTQSQCYKEFEIIAVSIPHRYDKNYQQTTQSDVGNGFQFLIGTIKTSQSRRAAGCAAVVSIPHRYDKNSAKMYPTSIKCSGFNSS